MANDDTIAARGGLLPVGFPFGNFRRNYYRLTTSVVAVFVGQPMDLDTNGQAIPALANSLGTSIMIGPVIGFARDMNGKAALPDEMLRVDASPSLPASVNGYVCIADDPNQIFVIQEGTATTQLTTANIGSSVGFSYLRTSQSSGSTLTGYSKAEIDASGVNATAGSGALQLIGLTDQMNSDGSFNALGQYAKWRVRIQNHRFATPPLGVSIIQ